MLDRHLLDGQRPPTESEWGRGLILQAIDRLGPRASLPAIAAALKLPEGTVSRYLPLLRDDGLLTRDEIPALTWRGRTALFSIMGPTEPEPEPEPEPESSTALTVPAPRQVRRRPRRPAPPAVAPPPEEPAPAVLSPDLTLWALRLAFRDHLRGEKRAGLTVIGYLKVLRYLITWLDAELGRPALPSDLTLAALRRYQVHRSDMSPRYMNQFVSAARAFCTFLQDWDLLIDNPAQRLKRPKVPERLPPVLSEAQAGALVQAPRSRRFRRTTYQTELLILRDLAILAVFYGGALRLSEVVHLTAPGISFSKDQDGRDQALLSVVKSKGAKDRTVPLQGKGLVALQDYLARRDELYPNGDHLFVSARGGRPLCPWATREVVYRYARALGLRVYPHLLRHTCATHLIRAHADQAYVSKFLGHTNLNNTSLYVHLAGSELGHRCASRHPLAQPDVVLGPVDDEAAALLEQLRRMNRVELAQVIQVAAVCLAQPGGGEAVHLVPPELPKKP